MLRRDLSCVDRDFVIYAAGLFDGEGCITAAKTQWGIYILLQVKMTDESIIRLFHEKFGGNFYSIPEDRLTNRKARYVWRLYPSDCVLGVLDLMLPYLRVKREQAELAVSFLRLGGKRSVYAKGERIRIRSELMRLNHQGLGDDEECVVAAAVCGRQLLF